MVGPRGVHAPPASGCVEVLRVHGGHWYPCCPVGAARGLPGVPVRRRRAPVHRPGRLRRPGHPRQPGGAARHPRARRRARSPRAAELAGAAPVRPGLGALGTGPPPRRAARRRLGDPRPPALLRRRRCPTCASATRRGRGSPATTPGSPSSSGPTLVRRAPDDPRRRAAAVLAFARLAGRRRALAWCAVDRCREVRARPLAGAAGRAAARSATPPDDAGRRCAGRRGRGPGA